jgi:peptide/nickel transport system ATP-binding protein
MTTAAGAAGTGHGDNGLVRGLVGQGLVIGYRRGVPVLDNVSLTLRPGRTLGILGPSGCGKSTLVRALALLQAPWSGTVEVDGQRVRGFRHAAPTSLRRTIGVVFQQPRLAVDPRFTLRRTIAQARPAALDDLADQVGLTPDLLDRRPHEVSEGQLQRACLARALATEPRYLLCDEMTAMLDASTTAALVQVVRAWSAAHGVGVLVVSHDEALLDAWCDKVTRWDQLVGACRTTTPDRTDHLA